jgi:hypothetical protein
VARVPNSALSLSQHRDEDASENVQREALKQERPEGICSGSGEAHSGRLPGWPQERA